MDLQRSYCLTLLYNLISKLEGAKELLIRAASDCPNPLIAPELVNHCKQIQSIIDKTKDIIKSLEYHIVME